MTLQRIDVLLSPHELPALTELKTGAVALDILRATSVMATAMAVGVAQIIPVSSPEAARALKGEHPDWLLAGEVGGLPPEGFDFGNSPLEIQQAAQQLHGQTLVMSTTNGTVLLNRLAEALGAENPSIYAGAYLNQRALCQQLLADGLEQIYLCCAGQKGKISLEDAACAGQLVKLLHEMASPTPEPIQLGDAAVIAKVLAERYPDPMEAFQASRHGQQLISLGLGDDLACCASQDSLSAVPRYYQGTLSL
jgi:2-phosphosulfolactate phosphatase